MIRTGAEYALIELTFEGSEEVREALRPDGPSGGGQSDYFTEKGHAKPEYLQD